MGSSCVVQTVVFFKYQRLSRILLVAVAAMMAFNPMAEAIRSFVDGDTKFAFQQLAVVVSIAVAAGGALVIVVYWGHRQGVWVDFEAEKVWFSYGLRGGPQIPFDALTDTTLSAAPLGVKLMVTPEFAKQYKYRSGATALSIPGFMTFGRQTNYNQLETDLPEPFESLGTPLLVLDPMTWKRALTFLYFRGDSGVLDGKLK